MSELNTYIPATNRRRRMVRQPQAGSAGGDSAGAAALEPVPGKPRDKRASKTTLVLSLLSRAEGATINQLTAATGWLPHTARAALTGLKKKGNVITSEKLEGQVRVYRVAGA